MSTVFTYISTKSTVDPFVPSGASSLVLLARDVSDGFSALSGGHSVVGKLALFPVQRSVPGHLLCDGREVAKASFPELFDYLGDSQGVSSDPNYFVLPDFLGSPLTAASTGAMETTVGGTVSSPDPTPPAPTDPPVEAPLYGNVDSGGRYRRITSTEEVV